MSMNQRDRLEAEKCPNDIDYAGWMFGPRTHHMIMKVTTRRLKDLFRKRVWYTCYCCDEVREEVQDA